MEKSTTSNKGFLLITLYAIIGLVICTTFSSPKPVQATTQAECYQIDRSNKQIARAEEAQVKYLNSIATELRNIRVILQERR